MSATDPPDLEARRDDIVLQACGWRGAVLGQAHATDPARAAELEAAQRQRLLDAIGAYLDDTDIPKSAP